MDRAVHLFLITLVWGNHGCVVSSLLFYASGLFLDSPGRIKYLSFALRLEMGCCAKCFLHQQYLHVMCRNARRRDWIWNWKLEIGNWKFKKERENHCIRLTGRFSVEFVPYSTERMWSPSHFRIHDSFQSWIPQNAHNFTRQKRALGFLWWQRSKLSSNNCKHLLACRLLLLWLGFIHTCFQQNIGLIDFEHHTLVLVAFILSNLRTNIHNDHLVFQAQERTSLYSR